PHLGRVENGGGSEGAEHAAVGDGEGAALQLLQGEGPGPGPFGQDGDPALDLREAEPVRIPDDRNDETLIRGHGDADVVILLDQDLLSLNLRVEEGKGL